MKIRFYIDIPDWLLQHEVSNERTDLFNLDAFTYRFMPLKEYHTRVAFLVDLPIPKMKILKLSEATDVQVVKA